MPPSPAPPLQFNVRSDMFSQLAAMENAGLPPDKAFAMLRLPKREQKRVERMSRWLSLGLDVSESGLRSGLFTPLEASLLRAAASGGSPAHMYRRLGDYYAQRAARWAAMKSRMAMPVAMLVITAFVQPLPQVVAGTLGSGGYLLAAMRPLLFFGVVAFCVLRSPVWLQRNSMAAARTALYRLLPRIPVFGPMHVRRNLRDFFETLALLLEAGLPILDALPKALDTIGNTVIREDFALIATRIEGGASFAQALSERAFAGRERAHPLLHSGEASGSLPEMLLHYADQETTSIRLFDELVAEWIPRLVYALVAASIVYGLLHGAGVGPELPEDLR